ncbi:hypothetical protein [Novipirellula artificiosorum]|uniref:Transmembrane protein n=1 Tax=Novipirellula artificiosorum TaxID=2528016 RepID=A0A5C6E5L6_9BACT|nr:hypothetical protein [Novipirellula artificiosorum]TWU42746.1 hypothetical protein Poly41_10460 [Novipirellula artificiosorum]
MTVSPNPAQDGRRGQLPHPAAPATGGPESDASLPPTLFQLQNLYRSSTAPTAQGCGMAHEPICSQTDNVPQSASTKQPEPAVSLDQDRQAKVQAPAEPNRHPSAPLIVDPIASIPHASSPHGSSPHGSNPHGSNPHSSGPIQEASVGERAAAPDAPSGRGWVESMGSHSLVLVLLFAVVVAALVVGRRSQNRANQANSSEGESFELVPPTDLISFATAETTPSEMSDEVPLVATLSAPIPEATAGSTPSATDSPLPTSRAANRSGSAMATTVSEMTPDAREAQVSELATTAHFSNRYPTATDEIVAPEVTAQPAAIQSSNPQDDDYPATATPDGISNWENYFPTGFPGQ